MDKKKILSITFFLILLLAIPVGLYLIRQQQVLRSRATTTNLDAFELKDARGNTINCDSSTNPPTCITGTLDFTVRVKDLNPLLGQ